jgi:hypothetical protein
MSHRDVAAQRAEMSTREGASSPAPPGCFVVTFGCARYRGTGGVRARPGLATLTLEPGSRSLTFDEILICVNVRLRTYVIGKGRKERCTPLSKNTRTGPSE